MPRSVVLASLAPFLLATPVTATSAQQAAGSVLDRTPNLTNGWLGAPGTVHFNFVHRFTESGPPEHQVSNSPTFVVAAGLPWRATAGFAYATTSAVVPRRPNEWELFARVMPFARGNPVADLTVHVGYNQGAASLDAELALARTVGPLRLLAAGRIFENAFRAGERRSAVAGGATLRLARYLSVAGDVGALIDRREDEQMAWSAGVHLGIPNTPHSLSLHASNVLTTTLQGASRGVARTRYGFEYTVPITLARYFSRRAPEPPAVASAALPDGEGALLAAGADTVHVDVRELSYAPARVEVRAGTTIVWTNRAPLAHTVTADDGSFDSGTIAPGKRWARTFTRTGTHPIHCTPHPFMKGEVVVR